MCILKEMPQNKRENYCGQKEQTLCVNLSLRLKNIYFKRLVITFQKLVKNFFAVIIHKYSWEIIEIINFLK